MIELWVFLAGLAGAVLAAWSLISSCRELQALILSKLNGPKKLAGISNIMRDSFLMSAQVIVVVLGMWVLESDASDAPSLFHLTLLSLVAISVLLTGGLIVDRVRRIKVMQLYDQLEAKARAKEPEAFFHKRATDDPR